MYLHAHAEHAAAHAALSHAQAQFSMLQPRLGSSAGGAVGVSQQTMYVWARSHARAEALMLFLFDCRASFTLQDEVSRCVKGVGPALARAVDELKRALSHPLFLAAPQFAIPGMHCESRAWLWSFVHGLCHGCVMQMATIHSRWWSCPLSAWRSCQHWCSCFMSYCLMQHCGTFVYHGACLCRLASHCYDKGEALTQCSRPVNAVTMLLYLLDAVSKSLILLLTLAAGCQPALAKSSWQRCCLRYS